MPLVAFAAGSLIGGAFFHLIPAALQQMSNVSSVFLSVSLGFIAFLALEQFMHWHHCHRKLADRRDPTTYLILVADGLHNFLGGLAIGSVFLTDVRMGVLAWLAAAMHEIPQELGDFGVLVHGGWKKNKALMFNFLSGLTFLAGGMIAYLTSTQLEIDTNFLIAFGAGNFIYIGASDLIPQINKEVSMKINLVLYGSFILGLALLFFLSFI